MNVLSILLIIALIFGIAVFFKVIKNVFKAAIYLFVLAALVLFIGAVVVYTDGADFTKKIQSEPLTITLVEDGKVLAGLETINYLEGQYALMNNESILRFQEAYTNNNYILMLGDSYKLLIFNMSAIEQLKINLSYDMYNLSSEEGLAIIRSNSALDKATDIFSVKLGIPDKDILKESLVEEFETDYKMKSAVFSMFLGQTLPSQTLYIVNNIKSEEIVIYPKSAIFYAINYVPTSWLNRGEQNKSEVLEE